MADYEGTVFGTRVRMARAHKGIDQATAGKIVGTSHAHIRAVENGEKPMNEGQLYMLAQASELPMEFFTADFALLEESGESADQDRLARIEQLLTDLPARLAGSALVQTPQDTETRRGIDALPDRLNKRLGLDRSESPKASDPSTEDAPQVHGRPHPPHRRQASDSA